MPAYGHKETCGCKLCRAVERETPRVETPQREKKEESAAERETPREGFSKT